MTQHATSEDHTYSSTSTNTDRLHIQVEDYVRDFTWQLKIETIYRHRR